MKSDRQPGGTLTDREREVLGLMARGLTNGEIAERLDISFATAKSHVSAIIGKLGVETREEAVRRWRAEQRPAARFSRIVRGLVAGVGMWKMAGGAAAVAIVGVGTAAGVAAVATGGDDGSKAAALDAAATSQPCEWNGIQFPIDPIAASCPESEFFLTTVSARWRIRRDGTPRD